MDTLYILWRDMKWRFQNPISILLTIVQPVLWLVLYNTVAEPSMKNVTGGNYTAFILPGILVLITLACCSSGGYLNFIAKSKGSFYRILIAPVRRSSICLGKMLEAVLVTYLEAAILLILSLFFSLRIASGLTGLLLIFFFLFLAAFFMSGITYAISLCLPNEAVYETLMNILVLSIFFTSPALFPMDQISGALKIVVFINPFTYIINGIRSLIVSPVINWLELWKVSILFLCLGLASLWLALWRLRKETMH